MEERTAGCPLGAKCEEVKDEILYRCPWHQKLLWEDQKGNSIEEYRCAIAWTPIMLAELAKLENQTIGSVQSLRNETVRHTLMMGAGLREKMEQLNGPDS